MIASPVAARNDEDWLEARRPSLVYQPAPPQMVRYGREMADGAARGDYIKNPTFLNLLGSLIINFTPAAPVADFRDFTANFKKSWESNFGEHKKDVALAAVGFIPVLGESKKIRAAFQAGKNIRLAQQIEQAVVKFAPALESGLTRKLQRSITEGIAPGEFVAVRQRVYEANFLDGKIPAKAAGDVVDVAYKNGVRKLTDGRRVISDLDLAFVAKHGRAMPESRALVVGEKINAAYGTKVVMHGDNFNGARRGIDKALEIEKRKEEMVYVFSRDGFIDAGNYQSMLRRYLGRTKE